MNTTENNKLIAEFMGLKMGAIESKCEDPRYNDGSIGPIRFHESWDWLMPVVEKIESLGHIVAIISHKTEISTKEEYPNKAHCMMAPGPKLNTTYQAVIKFIERHPENKEL